MGSIVVFGNRLIDGTGSDPIENAVVIIENDIITEIGRKGEINIPKDALTIEGTTMMPGLIPSISVMIRP